MTDGHTLFREILRNHGHLSTEEAAPMVQAEAMAHVAAALQEQNEQLERQNDLLEEIETNTRSV